VFLRNLRLAGHGMLLFREIDSKTFVWALASCFSFESEPRKITGKSMENPNWPPILGLASYFPPSSPKVTLKPLLIAFRDRASPEVGSGPSRTCPRSQHRPRPRA